MLSETTPPINERNIMDNSENVGIVQQQATVGQILDEYINGAGVTAIAEKYGIAPEKVGAVIQQADREGKFMPPNSEAEIDKVSDTPVEPVVEGENPAPTVATTKNSV